MLFAGEGDEDEGLAEFVLAHHSRQLHDGGNTTRVIIDPRRAWRSGSRIEVQGAILEHRAPGIIVGPDR